MKLCVIGFLGVFALALHADPAPEALAFGVVNGATLVERERSELPREQLPPGLLRELGQYHWSGGEDPDHVHLYEGFTLDLNGDDQLEYFIHAPYASGSGGPAYEIFSRIRGVWKHIGGYQGVLWTLPSDDKWIGLVSVGSGGGDHLTKVFLEFKDSRYMVARLLRFEAGRVTEEKPEGLD